MEKLILIVMAMLFCGFATISLAEDIPGYEFVGSVNGVDSFSQGGATGSLTKLGDVYYKPNGDKPIDDIAIQLKSRLGSQWVWPCSRMDKADKEMTLTFDVGYYHDNVKALFEENGLQVHPRYAALERYVSCSGNTMKQTLYLNPSSDVVAAMCKDCYEELGGTIVGNTMTSKFFGLEVSCGDDLKDNIMNTAYYTSGNLKYVEKLMLFFDDRENPTRASAMVLRKCTNKTIPEPGKTNAEVVKTEQKVINGRTFVQTVKVYADNSRSMRYLRANGLPLKTGALAYEYAAYQDASKTSEIIIGYFQALGEDACDDMLDGEMTPQEQALLDGLEKEAEQRLQFN